MTNSLRSLAFRIAAGMLAILMLCYAADLAYSAATGDFPLSSMVPRIGLQLFFGIAFGHYALRKSGPFDWSLFR